MKSGFWIIIVILAAGLGYWAGYDVASKPPKEVTVIKEVPAVPSGKSGSAASGGYGAPAPAPAASGGYGAPAAPPAASGGYGTPAPAPAGGYGK